MDIKLLEDIGLTKIQARTYLELIKSSRGSAPSIASLTNESRTNTYKVLDRLCQLGLATKDSMGKKNQYYPTSPAALERLIQSQAAAVSLRERKLHAALPSMLDFFFAHSERPSIRYFQGKEGLRQIFGDMLKTGKTIHLLRSPADVSFYDEAFFADFRKRRAKLNIKTYALTPNVPSAVHDQAMDLKNKFFRTWLPPDMYTASVEWDVYGNKVALISYGEEAVGIIIESAQIAESFRQVLALVTRSQA